MKKSIRSLLFSSLLFSLLSSLFAVPAFAFTEIGINYNYKKSAFDSDNISEQQSATGSLAFYFWERLGLELSYTNGLYVKKEKQPDFAGAFLRETTIYTDAYGADLIYIFADKKTAFQPFIKGGAAYIKRRQVVQDSNNNPWEIEYKGLSPSYGVGFKLFLTEAFALRASYDILETPVDNNTKVEEVTGRVGISWML